MIIKIFLAAKRRRRIRRDYRGFCFKQIDHQKKNYDLILVMTNEKDYASNCFFSVYHYVQYKIAVHSSLDYCCVTSSNGGITISLLIIEGGDDVINWVNMNSCFSQIILFLGAY